MSVIPPPSSQRRALLFGLGTVMLWSTVATAFKLGLEHVTPVTLVFTAVATSWVFLALYCFFTNRFKLLRALSHRGVLIGMAMGLLNPLAYYLVLFAAYARLPAQEAMAINYTWALTLGVLAAIWFKQPLTLRQAGSALVSYIGIVIIATKGAPWSLSIAEPVGIALALTSTLLWALYWILNTGSSSDSAVNLLLNFTGGFIALAAIAVPLDLVNITLGVGFYAGLYIGLFEMGISFVLWLTALRYATNTLQISSLAFLSPPISLCLIWLILGEAITQATLVGLSLIFCGLFLQHAHATTNPSQSKT
jgi:hypothetical protein